ncbi:hypothetical protein [Roseovarius faecimaris]|uniref:hypothetical protein n=1 Tax=Roseovarius faecimaris TaxID=2494550 RepID=UPI0012FDC68A|nr:hypothetical protein [Roseovarius faecimaris]
MSLLLKPIRLILLCGGAFIAGVFYERTQSGTECASLALNPGPTCTEETAHG